MESKILGVISALNTTSSWKVVALLGYGPAITICEAISEAGRPCTLEGEIGSLLGEVLNPSLEKLEDITTLIRNCGYGERSLEMAEALVSWAYDIVEGKETELKMLKLSSLQSKTANRSEYLEQVTMTFRVFQTKEGAKTGWRGDTTLKCSGLLARCIELELGPQHGPAAIQIVNLMPDDDRGKQLPIPQEEWEKLWKAGLVVSGERLAWDTNHPAWGWLKMAFPNAIDLSPYNHSLNAPVLPEGFLPNCRVVAKELKDSQGKSLGADGHGFYHPETKELQNFVLKYGAIPIQIRGINNRGIFCKGVLFPSDTSLDNMGKPCITLDWLQIKGRHKALAKQRLKEGAQAELILHLGVINVWRRHGRLPFTFETLENIQMRPETTKLIEELVIKAMNRIARGGVDALMASLARDNNEMKLILQLITQMKNEGLTIEPTQIPRVKELLEDRLCRKLWDAAQGAGVKTHSSVAQLDATLEPGTCTITGVEEGREVIVYRFPTVLSQGLATLKTVKPLKHHLAQGKMSPATIVMHPHDMVGLLQGDSDGDIVGWSFDEKLLELWRYVEKSPFQIRVEPEGEPLIIPCDSKEGLEYILKDQQGPVGTCTNLRSSALAIGRRDLADGMSYGIQEAIDEEKRKVLYTDFRAAGDYSNYVDGRCTIKLPKKLYEEDKFPAGLANEWIGEAIVEAGCYKIWPSKEGPTLVAGNALGWRHRGKRLNYRVWKTTAEAADWNGGNLVHFCHDTALTEWKKIENQINLDTGEINISLLLPILLQKKGLLNKMELPTQQEYEKGLRIKCGLAEYGKTMNGIFNKNLPDEERFAAFDTATATLQHTLGTLTIEEMAIIWVMECSSGTDSGLNHAIRAVAWPGSPIMTLLGIEQEAECDFLDPEKIKAITNWALKSPEPSRALSDKIFGSSAHELKIIKNGEGIPGWRCPACTKKLTDGLVRQIRKDKSRAEHDWIKLMVRKLKA